MIFGLGVLCGVLLTIAGTFLAYWHHLRIRRFAEGEKFIYAWDVYWWQIFRFLAYQRYRRREEAIARTAAKMRQA
jgi:hypothetical protein